MKDNKTGQRPIKKDRERRKLDGRGRSVKKEGADRGGIGRIEKE